MRVLLLCNNWVGWQVARWLCEQREDVVGLVLHPAAKRKFGEETLQALAAVSPPVFDASLLRREETLYAISLLKADIAVSAFFGYILKPDFLRLFPQGCINIHPSFLPYNRGAHPNVWSIIEGTPAGVTIHCIDANVDTGDIVAQQEVPVSAVDTGETLYRKLEQTSMELFRETWPSIKSGAPPVTAQAEDHATVHRAADVDSIDRIELDAHYKAADLINILRARTFPPYSGAYFLHEGRKIFLRLQLLDEHEI